MALKLGELYAVIDARDNGLHSKINKAGRAVDGLGGKLVSALAKATVFSALAAGAAGAASSMGPLIGLVGVLGVALATAAAAIPAFAVAGAAAVATLTIGFSNLGDAIAGDEEALKKLAPSAKAVVSVLQDLKPAWEDVTKSVQEKLFTGLADDIADVAGVWLPLLKTGLGKVASGFNAVGASAAQALQQSAVIQGFNDVVTATGQGLKNFAAGVGPWLAGIGVLLSAFAPLLEEAGTWAANLGVRFAEFITRAQASGQIADFIEQMKNTFSLLGDIAGNVGSILFNVFAATAESGGGLLGVIENLTGQFADFLNSAAGWDALTTFFAALRDVGDAVLPIILALASAFATDLAPTIADIAREVGPTLADLVREIGDAIGGIDITTLAGGFADVLEAVIPLIEPLGNIIGWFSQIEGLVPVLVVALAAWAVAQWALNIAMYANPILLIIMLIAALIAAVVLIIINWDIVKEAIVANWEFTKEKASAIWGAIADFFVMIGTAIKDFFVGIWTSIKDFFVGIWNAITAFASAKINQILATIGWLASLPGKVGEWFQGVYNSAKDKLTSLVDWVKGLPGRILDAIGDLGSLLANAGRDLINGLLDGIRDKFGDVQDMLSDLTSQLPDWKGPASVDRVLLQGPAELIMSGFAESLAAGFPMVKNLLQGFTSELGMEVTGGTNRIEATASLSDEDRELLRDLAAARTRLDISTDANTRVKEIRRDAMVVG